MKSSTPLTVPAMAEHVAKEPSDLPQTWVHALGGHITPAGLYLPHRLHSTRRFHACTPSF